MNNHSHTDLDTHITTLLGSDIDLEAMVDIQQNLRLKADELMRMESEGGLPMDAQQSAKVHRYINASKRIENVLLNVEFSQIAVNDNQLF